MKFQHFVEKTEERKIETFFIGSKKWLNSFFVFEKEGEDFKSCEKGKSLMKPFSHFTQIPSNISTPPPSQKKGKAVWGGRGGYMLFFKWKWVKFLRSHLITWHFHPLSVLFVLLFFPPSIPSTIYRWLNTQNNDGQVNYSWLNRNLKNKGFAGIFNCKV